MSISTKTPAVGLALRSSNKDLLEKVIIDVAHQCNVHPSQVEDLYPCTHLQHGLMVLSMASTASKAAYVAQFVFRLNEHVDTRRMKKAWATVIQRNAILRTRIVNRDARTFQVVLKAGSLDWVDFTDLPQYLGNESQRSMQYGQVLSHLAMSETYMVWTAHHSVYDGFSVELLLTDIATVYEGGNLPAHTPFKNFIKHTQHVDQAQCRSFWTSRLSNKDVLPFPPIRKPNQRPRPNKTMEHHALSVALAASQVTTATIVQAAWILVLSSQLSSATVSFGLTVNGRNTPVAGIETIMGPTLATVPVCFHINLDQSVTQYLQNVQQYFTEMIPYQHVGLQKIKEINAEACEFQNLLAIHHAEQAVPHSKYDPLFKREAVETAEDFFNYAMVLQCSLSGSGALRAHASFDEDLIDTMQMQRLLCQLEHIVRQLGSSDRGRTLREISLVAPEDLQQIQRWNTKPDTSSGFPLQEIQGHFRARPRSTAICSWDGQMTYSELDTLSSKLAEYLASRRGIGPEVIVPLCFDRSQWMIVAIVAVMKAGGAFTLLDPTYPIERLKRIINTTGCETVLVSKSCDSIFSSPLVVDAEFFKSNASMGAAVVNLQVNGLDLLSVENAMYVVFTSGSTGEPKGVIITHGSYYAGAMAHIPVYELGPQSRNLLFGSPSFDLCIQEIVSTLMAGGCLCVPSSDDHMGDITSVIRSMDVNIASFTSSFARQIRPEDVPSLQILALVGEALAKDQQEAWADKLCLMNSYGPSECSVISTIKKGLTRSTDTRNIGEVIVGSAWIVDPHDHNRQVPIGAAGELLIEGPLLGRGYLDDPEKTAASFIVNPLWAINPEGMSRRFYKTGDVVRYDVDDGSLIFEGRKDTQVKIRGQRVEIGEVEYHLGKLFPKASGVAVELSKQEDVSQLIALIFCGGIWDATVQPQTLLQSLVSPGIGSVSDIKSHLKRILPQHMIPSRYRLAQSMPLLPSGKLDRKEVAKQIRESAESHLKLHETNLILPYIDQADHIGLRLSEKLVRISAGKDDSVVTRSSQLDLNLSALNLDSIQLINFLAFIRKEFSVNLPIAVLYDDTLNISVLSEIISDRKSGISARDDIGKVDLQRQIQASYEALLAIPAQRVEPMLQITTGGSIVFLTGATGYLGSEILRQLLNDVSLRKVIVHVRAQDATRALDRIKQAALLAKWWSPSYIPRIICWPGDLAEPRLGLSPHHWRILEGDCTPEERISVIIHNGAAVQWQAPYSSLKAANVDSTVALLAAIRRWPFPASFTYVSGGVEVHRVEELELLSSRIETNANGYSQTKFVSEQLVSKVAQTEKSRVAYSVVKPGLIVGTEDEGIPNTDDFLWRLVQACITIGGYPVADGDFWLAVADVNEVAASIIVSSSRAETRTQRFRMVVIEAGVTVDDFWAIVTAELGSIIAVKPMKGEDWVLAIRALLEYAKDDHPYRPLEAMLQESSYSLGSPNVAKAQSHTNVCRAIRKNIQSLLDAGFFAVSNASGEQEDKSHLGQFLPSVWQTTTFSRSGIYRKSKFVQDARALEDGICSSA